MILSLCQVKLNNWHSQNDVGIGYGNYSSHCELIVYICASVFNGGHLVNILSVSYLPVIVVSRSIGTNLMNSSASHVSDMRCISQDSVKEINHSRHILNRKEFCKRNWVLNYNVGKIRGIEVPGTDEFKK